MVERKMLINFSPLRLLFGWKPKNRSHVNSVKKSKYMEPKDEALFAPETNQKILIEHYKNIGRGPT